MSVLGNLVLGMVGDGNMRLVLLILLALAVIFLIAGGAIALFALRHQRNFVGGAALLKSQENEAP